MSRTATLLSYAAGGTGTIAAESRNWESALGELGFSVRRVAGRFDAEPNARSTSTDSPGHNVLVSALASGTSAGNADAIVAALAGSDLVIVDNLCSTDQFIDTARTVEAALIQFTAQNPAAGVLFRHHDLPWDRGASTGAATLYPAPPRITGAVHAPLNLRGRRSLEARGYDNVVMVQKYFDFDLPHGDRAATRSAMGFADDDIVLWQPTKADARNNFAGTVRYLQQLVRVIPAGRVKLWLSGPVGDSYRATFDKLAAHIPVDVRVERIPHARDGYAACDVVLFPAARDRFGTIFLESIAARKPCVISGFPALGELEACGLKYFHADEPGELVKFLAKPSERFFDTNERRARISFSIEQLPAAISAALIPLGLATA